ncbi:MAG: DUF1566 domain-containing protein [Desulfuromonadaceae bacterium]|nr:DUF1566 domain-containing protein [Desulfuromonadaceae bacterium]
MQRSVSSQSFHPVSNRFRILERISAKTTGFLLLISGVALLGACGGGGNGSPTNNDTTGAPVLNKVSGLVVDKSGTPLSGVTISIFHHNEKTTVTTTTDANGFYSVSGQSTGLNSDYAIYAGKTGFGFYPSVGDAAGSVGKLDFNGLYRTVIRFLSMPGHDVTNANFTALRPGDKMASLPQTGQTTSYASGDDYSVRAGVAWPGTRFTDNQNGTVTDNLTGLVWLKNAGCFTPTNWATALTAANQLASGQCGLTDGSTAGQWRMPNVNELESLVDVSHINPAVSSGSAFTNINLTAAYWSSTTYTALPSNAMAIRFSDGRWINGIDSADGSFTNNKNSSANSLWVVKSGGTGAIQILATGVYDSQGGASFGVGDDASLQIGAPLTFPRFIDNSNGTLSDTVTGLTWLKKADCIKLKQSWTDAITAVNTLASGQCGLTDGSTAGQWRMPNRSEMLSLSDRSPTFPQANYFNGIPGADGVTAVNPTIFNNFIAFDYYWTSTTNAADIDQAWTIYSCDFGVYNVAKTDSRYSLAVR